MIAGDARRVFPPVPGRLGRWCVGRVKIPAPVKILGPIRVRAAHIREHGGALGAACGTLEDTRSRLDWAEHGSFAVLRRMAAMVFRFILDVLVVVVIALFELDTLRRRAGNALAGPPRH